MEAWKREYKKQATIDAIVESSRLQEVRLAVRAIVDDDYKILVSD
jgi:hypothetical protein